MKKTAIVFGASRGIGLAFAKKLASDGYHVFGLVRKKPEGESEIHWIENWNSEDPENFKLGQIKIDLMVHSAGFSTIENLPNPNWENYRKQIEINAIAPIRSAIALIPIMNENSKMVFVSSFMGSITLNDRGGDYAYRSSKAALNASVRSLAIDLKPKKIWVCALHPGYVQTDMTGMKGDITAKESAEMCMKVIDGSQETGTFLSYDGSVLPF
jgi:NAD(P)-dependent dehydrogenase (short-subunit alcohol dehydrogenase family)